MFEEPVFKDPADVALCASPSTGAGCEVAGAVAAVWHQPLREPVPTTRTTTRTTTKKIETNRTPARARRSTRPCRSVEVEQSLHGGVGQAPRRPSGFVRKIISLKGTGNRISNRGQGSSPRDVVGHRLQSIVLQHQPIPDTSPYTNEERSPNKA